MCYAPHALDDWEAFVIPMHPPNGVNTTRLRINDMNADKRIRRVRSAGLRLGQFQKDVFKRHRDRREFDKPPLSIDCKTREVFSKVLMC